MADLDTKFNEAAEAVKNLSKKPENEELLKLYALFKQGTCGDCNTEKPGMFDLKGKAKWEAWKEKSGMSQTEAKENYVQLVSDLKKTYA